MYIIPGLPDIDTLRDVKMQIPLRIYSRDQALIGEFGEKRRTPVQIEEVPQDLINAVLAAEDDRFYKHPGVDWKGISRAAWDLIRTGEKRGGGSTITMQVARNFFLSFDKLYMRKITEIFLALKIESLLSKDEILELYLNKIYFGQRAYGVGAAAQVYYGIDVKDLNLAQIAMIAGLPQRPSPNNPVTSPERAMKRRSYVLRRMLEEGFISRQQFEEANSAPVTATLHNPKVEMDAPYVAEMVRMHLINSYGENVYNDGYRVTTTIRNRNQVAAGEALRKALLEYDQRHGFRGAEHHYNLEDGMNEQDWEELLASFSSISGIDAALIVDMNEHCAIAYSLNAGLIELEQERFEWARKYISENRRGSKPKGPQDVFQIGDVVRVANTAEEGWHLVQIPDVEGGLVSLDPNNGAILALVGGFDFQKNKYNRITQARRQPGSSFKPFIYSAALNAGFTAATMINDAPVVVDDPGIEDVWRPGNYEGNYLGRMRLREAITKSRNLVSIRLLDKVGVPQTLEYLTKFGYDTGQLPRGLSLALGSGEITPWQHATAYSILANGGYRIEPYFIESIATHDDEILFTAQPVTVCPDEARPAQADAGGQDPAPLAGMGSVTNTATVQETTAENTHQRCASRVIDPEIVWIINDMTRDVIQYGTGRKAKVLKRGDLSGKTGTTNDQTDAWFAGFNTGVVTIAWVGFDDFVRKLGNNETGGVAALPMWIDYMRVALEDIPDRILDRPPGLVDVLIDPKTGELANADHPGAIFETFRAGQVPARNIGETGPGISSDGEKPGEIYEQLF